MVLQPMYRDCDGHDGTTLVRTVHSHNAVGQLVPTFSEVHFARVDALKRQIAAGTYRVPTALLAHRLMERMRLPYWAGDQG